MLHRHRCRLQKIEAVFFIGAIIYLCWTFSTLFLQSTSVLKDGGALLGLMPPAGAMLSSLFDFTSHGHESHGYDNLQHVNQTEQQLVYMVGDVAGGPFVVADWNQLSKKWHSKSTYINLIEYTQNVDAGMLPSPDQKRIVFILHNHPKMASTTLRRACWENLRSTCNIVSPKRDPMGYSNANDLASLITKCQNTYHYCVMGWHFDSNNFPNITTATLSSSTIPQQPVTYIHLFPFRNFNDWAVSAMKQVFVGHSEAGCKAVSQRLDNCIGWLELDFAKYTKRGLALMLGINKAQKGGVEGGMQQQNAHHFVLYDYSKVQSTLLQLSRLYHVPMLSHLDMQYKQIRQDGSCPNETLKKFHDCFDEQLLSLQ